MKYRAKGPILLAGVLDNLWSKVCRDGGDNACWDWTSFCDERGNPSFRADPNGGRRYNAKKLLYDMIVWDVPSVRFVASTCKNRLCMNPRHLTIVTFSQLRGWYDNTDSIDSAML